MDRIRSDTVFIMFFADMVNRGHLADVCDGYLAQYRGLIEFIESLLNLGLLAGQLWARGLGLAFYRASADYLDQHRAMLIPAPVKTRNRSDLVVEDEDI